MNITQTDVIYLLSSLMKFFKTFNTERIAECQRYFRFSLPSKLVERKRNTLVNNYNNVSPF